MDRETRLETAKKRIFSLGLNDAAAQLCVANMAFGIAKLNIMLEKLGYEPDAIFIGSPDMTITRNSARWDAGFGYGGKLQWGSGDRPLVVLDAKPNACGMLAGSIEHLPDVDGLLSDLHDLYHTSIEVDGIEIEWDFHRGNHFIDLCTLEPTVPGVEFAPYAFVLHSAAPELKGENPHGPGLYWDESPTLADRARLIDTPFGPLHVLLDDDAVEFFEFYRRAEQFAKKRRLAAAEAIFGDFRPIANATHQGMTDPNTLYLGCHNSLDETVEYLPIMIRSDLPGYLFEGLPNLSDQTIERLGFYDRAVSMDALEALRNANIIPHGAGYSLPHFRDVVRVIDLGDHRCFEMSPVSSSGSERDGPTGDVVEILADTHDLPQKYRGRQGVFKSVECGLGRMVGKLTPVHVVKV
ncbi:MAG: hypothetical protein ACLFWB_06140 [Armatimonadota bacterium]